MQCHIILAFNPCMHLPLTAIEVAHVHLKEESEPEFGV